MNDSQKYCFSLTEYKRFTTREVMVGNLPLGGTNPIRIQSMTTTDTMDTIATVEQTIRMVNAGCDYVRITAPSIKEAQNLKNIKAELRKRGYNVPLIADIHFTPKAAEEAAKIVEKVRINPGNYIDKKNFQKIDYTESEYQEEIEKIRERITPLIKICIEHGTAMRIGTNHGSLSDRIMSRYGDTPLGMVESAMEFLRICEDLDYRNVVLSMKSSNTRVMVQAYRLLVNKMLKENMNYPLHLGVTEAGDGEDGRIKSAVGIGTLLEDGLGDTIRVSLTEEPENEAPVAIALADRYEVKKANKSIPPVTKLPYDPFNYFKFKQNAVSDFGANNTPRVITDLSNEKLNTQTLENLGFTYSEELDKWKIKDLAPDYLYISEMPADIKLPEQLKIILPYNEYVAKESQNTFPLYNFDNYFKLKVNKGITKFIELTLKDVFQPEISDLIKQKNVVFVLTSTDNGFAEQRRALIELANLGNKLPVIIKRSYTTADETQFQLYSATDFGGLFTDGFGDGIWVKTNSKIGSEFATRTMFGILQAARVRISKTEYIACPSCGRTLFDLVEITNEIRKRTGHLKGVKIGIMGCIVNGPGEMADADYGYVGSGPGKITLYKGKEVVRKNVPQEEAVEGLIDLIKEDNAWVEPKN